jgi:glycine cleavage system H protein
MDFLATKGIEYLLVIGYLIVLIPFWRLVFGGARRHATVERPEWQMAPLEAMRPWFQLPEGLHFHRGHAWAVPEGEGLFRVGIDDFAQRLVGPPDGVELPAVGGALEQGAPGWSLRFNGEAVRMLAPVAGEVVETNAALKGDPGLVCQDPYGQGWLMKVRARVPEAALGNLLSGRLARAWMDETAERLSAHMGPSLGPVLQDGGIPVSGFARELSPEGWRRIAEEHLLSAS